MKETEYTIEDSGFGVYEGEEFIHPYKKAPTLEEIQKQTKEATEIQNKGMDDIWLAINYAGLGHLAQEYATRKNLSNGKLQDFLQYKVDADDNIKDKDVDIANLSKQEKDELIKEFYKENQFDYYTKKELGELEFAFSDKNTEEIGEYTSALIHNAAFDHFTKPVFEDNREEFIKLGILKGKVIMGIGAKYKEWLNALPEDDPYREQKATYLAVQSEGPGFELGFGFSEMEREACNKNANSIKSIKFLKNTDQLKKMTVKNYFDYFGLEEKGRDTELQKYRVSFPNISMDSNIYEVLKAQALRRRDNKEDKSPVSDNEILYQARKEYTHYSRTEWIAHGMELVKAKVKQQDMDAFQFGYDAAAQFKQFKTKGIEDWVKNEAPALLAQKKLSNLNDAYKKLQSNINSKKPYNIETTGIMDRIVSANKYAKTDYDKYMTKHSGFAAANSNMNERKVHLAKYMAATTFKDKKAGYNISNIHAFAEQLMKRDAFKNLTPEQIREGISGPRGVHNIQLFVYEKTFGVDFDKRQNYIDAMNELSKNMMQSNKRGDKYKELCDAVKNVANKSPYDRDFLAANDRLIKAIGDYTKGKKSVRSNATEKAKFDNALDAMSIVNEYIPGSRYFVKEQVNRINEVRKARQGGKNFVDINKYGAENAKEKNEARQNQMQNQKQNIKNNHI